MNMYWLYASLLFLSLFLIFLLIMKIYLDGKRVKKEPTFAVADIVPFSVRGGTKEDDFIQILESMGIPLEKMTRRDPLPVVEFIGGPNAVTAPNALRVMMVRKPENQRGFDAQQRGEVDEYFVIDPETEDEMQCLKRCILRILTDDYIQ